MHAYLSTKDAIPYRRLSMPQDRHKHLPGWTLELSLAIEQSLFWHFIWVACERPRYQSACGVYIPASVDLLNSSSDCYKIEIH